MSSRPFYANIHFLFITVGIAVNTLLAAIYRYINAGSPLLRPEELPGYYGQGWPIMVQTFVLLYFVYYSMRLFDKRYHHAPNSFQRFLKEILFILLAGLLIMEAFHWIFVTYMVVPEEDMMFLERKLKMIRTIDIAFLIVVYTFMTTFRIFRYLQQKNLEVLQWQREHAQTQFEAVKNQLNPHFLFNSLDALSSLVWIDANKAELFIEQLSRSYRYLLEQKDKQLVPLADELQFLQSFLALMHQRFGNKLQVHLHNLMPEGNTLPPHSLMIVFDYLLATNSMSTASPLQVTLTQEQAALHISCNRQPKESSNPQATEQLHRLQEELKVHQKELSIIEKNRQELSIYLPLFQ